MLEAAVFAVIFMNKLKDFTNVVVGNIGKVVHKQNCSHDFFLFYNYNIIIVQVRYIPGLHPSTHVEKETCYIQYGQLTLFQQYRILYITTCINKG